MKDSRINVVYSQADGGYKRPRRDIYTYVPDHAARLEEAQS